MRRLRVVNEERRKQATRDDRTMRDKVREMRDAIRQSRQKNREVRERLREGREREDQHSDKGRLPAGSNRFLGPDHGLPASQR